MRQYHHTIDSPIGPLTLAASGTHITAVHMGTFETLAPRMTHVTDWLDSAARLADAVAQLEAYFAGALRDFTLPVAPHGGPFQQRVWSALRGIPYGTTTSYGALAASIGTPGAARAVGAANGQNPVAIVIPCHRVIGADGSLTGYGGGLERKQFLLEHESRRAGRQLALAIESAS